MRRRLIGILAAIGLLLVSLIGPPSAGGITCPHGRVTFYDGLNATGAAVAYCAEDYPAAASAASWGAGQTFVSSTIPIDNHIESIRWDGEVPAGYRVKLFTGYNFVGTATYMTRLAGATVVYNLPTAARNTSSSFVSCGATCSDDPGG